MVSSSVKLEMVSSNLSTSETSERSIMFWPLFALIVLPLAPVLIKNVFVLSSLSGAISASNAALSVI